MDNKQELISRLMDEMIDLGEKLTKIKSFINSDEFKTLPSNKQAMLIAQKCAMNDYLTLLCVRIPDMEADCDEYSICGIPFSIALSFLKAGFPIARMGWNGKGLVVFRQKPADIQEDVIPNMTSLPEEGKNVILGSAKHINYQAQFLIYNKNSGRADSWVPSSSDLMANDWMLAL